MATPASFASGASLRPTGVRRVFARSVRNWSSEPTAEIEVSADNAGEVPPSSAGAATPRRSRTSAVHALADKRATPNPSSARSAELDDTLTDRELLTEWRSGQGNAGGLLLSRHRERLGRFLRNHAGDLADDLLQETLMVGVRQRDRFLGQASFRTYLFGIAKRLLRRAARREGYKAMLEFEQEPSFAERTSDVEEWESWHLFDAMLHLKEDERQILLQYFWDGLTGAEIGKALGVSERAIRSRLRRTIARLRQFI